MSVYEKINLVMSEVNSVVKGASVNMGKGSYKAVQHDDVTKALQPYFVKHKLVAIPSVAKYEKQNFKTIDGYGKEKIQQEVNLEIEVKFVDTEKPESTFTVKSFAYAFDSGDKAVGKAYSMAVKYVYLKTFMLESMDEEEQRQQEQYMKATSQKPLSLDRKIKQIDEIKAISAKLTDGKAMPEKMKFMNENLSVKSFDDLLKKSEQALDNIISNLKDLA